MNTLRKMKRIKYTNQGVDINKIYSNDKYQLKNTWTSMLLDLNFTKLVTIRPVWHKYQFEEQMSNLKQQYNINHLFYSIEFNTGDKYYHMHLMLDQEGGSKHSLAKQLNIPMNKIPYYETIKNKLSVSRYVKKYMQNEQLHYNFY